MVTPVLKEGCDVGQSQRDVFREAGEKNEERGMGPFLTKHVVLNIKYTNTYIIYIYTYLPIFICVCMTVISSLQSARPFCKQVPFITYDPWPRITVKQ